MARDDWLLGGERRTAAAERIYEAATDLVVRDGLDALDMDALAARVHCSRATVYRYAGAKPRSVTRFCCAWRRASLPRFDAR